ncbi:allergen Tha p 1-like [Onthophagus taurus]|uniref:allergen Tha p 1-like n=1 Tax=Onthophagus taurus TaxID=166361 RepID=UPI000C20D6AB|nr:ejaculatory bulb-specific protein 3-like [Onthophagus taurus]
MKSIAFLVILIAAVLVNAAEKYTTKYDNVNIDDILNNKRLLKGYTNCILDKGPCSPDGAELKTVLPDALATHCEKCNEKQKEGSKIVLRHLINKEPAIFDELEKMYDPKGEYRIRYKEEAAKEGINI